MYLLYVTTFQLWQHKGCRGVALLLVGRTWKGLTSRFLALADLLLRPDLYTLHGAIRRNNQTYPQINVIDFFRIAYFRSMT